jgi:hypothetical protein
MLNTKILHSLTQAFLDGPCGEETFEFSFLKNESFSFQVSYKLCDGGDKSLPIFVKVESELPIELYSVAYTPLIHADFSSVTPIRTPGLYPDILLPKKLNPEIVHGAAGCGAAGADYPKIYEKGEKLDLFAYNDSWQTLWLTVNENGQTLKAGNYTVKLTFTDNLLNFLCEREVCITVIDSSLSDEKIIYTNWFHCDCIADFYGVEIFSDRFFEIMRSFVRAAAKNGMNMILTPAFTPPLDTLINEERMTAQLVKVTVTDEGYEFDFSLLKRFIDICRDEGIEYFEHAHLFTQWGAKHSPKIIAWKNGEEKQISGWDTPTLSKDYIDFLRAYLTKLRSFIEAEGLGGKFLFHISDEPSGEFIPTYKAIYDALADLFEGFRVADALSHVEFFKSGLVKTPIANTRVAKEFAQIGGDVWCYYTGGEVDGGLSNRLLQISRERNRILGVQMYLYNVKGFLHWAYNYYYGQFSHGSFNPFINSCGGYPNGGTSYFVYPAPEGVAYQSVRQKVFGDGLSDFRALKQLEALGGRAMCEEIINEYFPELDFYKSPDTPEVFIEFRRCLNEKIKILSERK